MELTKIKNVVNTIIDCLEGKQLIDYDYNQRVSEEKLPNIAMRCISTQIKK